MKNPIQLVLYIILSITLFQCSLTDEEKLDKMLNSKELYIQVNSYGGFAGYNEQKFLYKKDKFETVFISNIGTNYRIYNHIEGQENLINSFILEAYNTNNNNRELSNSCMTGFDSEYILQSGFTTLNLKPDKKCDSIFNLILNYRK